VGCPDDEEFAALLSHGVDAHRRAEILDHAATCAACRSLISALAGTDTAMPSHGTLPTVDAPAAGTGVGDEDDDAIRRAVASALFAHDRKSKIGRYQLLEIVGAGGMGVVWGAWDPELARRVALKLVHPRLSAACDRILAEGQALAKLSHPNVVPVYDVGVVEGQVYLVMEWIQGATLRAYVSAGCSRRELLEAYRQAGEGLAAVHRAGLVHRDFKPDNAIRGEDGRVRVLDFGLAHGDEEQGAPQRLGGTPRYMPPEQAAGAQITPAADQYAFAVSLREALQSSLDAISATTGARPDSPGALEITATAAPEATRLPAWLARIADRGSAANPADRFASMELLLAALARDPARIWRRRVFGLAAATAAVAAFVAGRSHSAAPTPPPTCTGSTAEIAQSWNPAARSAVTAHLQQLGAYAAGEVTRLGSELDAYGTTWAAEHRRACLAHERGELPALLYERRIGCLARGKAALATVAELMVSVATDALPGALIAARSLPSAAGCTAEDASLVPPPPAAVAAQVASVERAIARARVLAIAAHPDAISIAQTTVAAAESSGYAPSIARALLVRGRAEFALHAIESVPRASFERAVDLALRGGDDVVAVEAYARLVWAVARYRGDVLGEWSVMEAISARTGALGRFGRALLYNNKAIARSTANDRPGAHALLLQALAASPIGEPRGDDLELTSIAQNLALFSDDPVERTSRSRQVAERLEAALGGLHPRALQARYLAATLTRDPQAAEQQFRTACEGFEQHPGLAYDLAACRYERAWLADDRGDAAAALAAMRLAARGPQSQSDSIATTAASYVAIAEGDHVAETAATVQALAAKLAAATQFWRRGEAADAEVVAALGWQRLGRAADAERCWSAAVALLASIQRPFYDRRLARARAALAQRWISSKPDEARRLAAAALAWYREAGGYEARVAELTGVAAAQSSR